MKKVLFLLVAVIFLAGMAHAEIDYGMRMGLTLDNVAMDPEFDEWGSPMAENKSRIAFYQGVWVSICSMRR